MFETLKEKTLKRSLGATVVLFIIAAVLFFFSSKGTYYAIFGYAEFEALAPNEIKNQMVDVNLTTNFGCCIEEYEYNKDTKVRKTTDLYYVIWTGDENVTDFRYMAIKVPVSYRKQMEKMADLSAEGYYDDPILFSGEIKKMGDKEYSYFKDYFTTGGLSEEDFREMTLPYYIDVVNKSGANGLRLTGFGTGIILLAIAVFRLIKATKGGYLKKLHDDIAAAGYSEASVETDYASAEAYTKSEDLKIGRLFIYYMRGATARALPIKDVVWAYQTTTTHKRNGITTGKTYTVTTYVNGNKSATELSVPNEAIAHNILDKMHQRFPWIIIGHTNELAALRKKDYQAFLNLRFNTVEHIPVEPGFEAYSAPAESDNSENSGNE